MSSMWNYNYLCHYGISGQKWGVRRYQNEDGTLTEEGKIRYNERYQNDDGTLTEEGKKAYEAAENLNAVAEVHAEKAGNSKFWGKGYHAQEYGKYSREADKIIKEAGFKNLEEFRRAMAVTNTVEEYIAEHNAVPLFLMDTNWNYIKNGK